MLVFYVYDPNTCMSQSQTTIAPGSVQLQNKKMVPDLDPS